MKWIIILNLRLKRALFFLKILEGVFHIWGAFTQNMRENIYILTDN